MFRPLGHGPCPVGMVLLLSYSALVSAAEPKLAEPTGIDYQVQGEYAGPVFAQAGDATPIGVQVIALGGGKFAAVGFLGGLPGDGWDRTPRHESKGENKDGSVEFKGEEYSGTVKDNVLAISVGQVKISELKKQDRQSSTLGAPPPQGAVVLFDGTSADKFEGGRIDEGGLLLPGGVSKEKFGDGTLHVEFRVPFMPDARGQDRGNSGVFVQGRYEVQILDSFGDEPDDRGCGAIYALKAPDQNVCYPPMTWQTYDIEFTAPQYQEGKKVEGSTALLSVKQNGRPIHREVKVPAASGGAKLPEGPEPGPLWLQDHRCEVRFRNIWFLPATAGKAGETK